MRVSTRIFFCYLLISGVCLYFPFDWVLDTMRARYLEGVEDPLVDQANILAAAVGLEMEQGVFDPGKWYAVQEQAAARKLNATIYDLEKKTVDTFFYITNDAGKVLFHSSDREETGKDYAQWRDVHLTLNGQYGARTSLSNDAGEDSSVLYVAAPIKLSGRIVGVLTIGKPTTNITWFVENAKLQIVVIAVLALVAAGLLGFLVSLWITRPINRLTGYARQIRDGRQPSLPPLDRSEIGEMGRAFEQMREALEGKRYVEHYVQNLTHEIKSPLSAIRGAAELLAEPMDPGRRERFIKNIQSESLRIQTIVDRMLELSALENRKKLLKREPVSLRALITTLIESLELSLVRKALLVRQEIGDNLPMITGDPFLLHQAIGNLLQNAIDFSPTGAVITIRAVHLTSGLRLEVIDAGIGIADFARDRIFEKFFSLQRPDSGEKSTGLGLNFVRQVALLHGGTVSLENNQDKGATAVLELPASIG